MTFILNTRSLSLDIPVLSMKFLILDLYFYNSVPHASALEISVKQMLSGCSFIAVVRWEQELPFNIYLFVPLPLLVHIKKKWLVYQISTSTIIMLIFDGVSYFWLS